MDWGIFHAINALGRHDDGLQDTIQWFAAHRESALVPT